MARMLGLIGENNVGFIGSGSQILTHRDPFREEKASDTRIFPWHSLNLTE